MNINVGRYWKPVFAAMGIAWILMGCDKHTLLYSYRHIPQEGWRNTDTLIFALDTLKEDVLCQFDIDLRSTDRYPYKSLWLKVERQFTFPDTTRCDTVQCQLTDPTTDRMGKGIYTYQYSVPLSEFPLRKGQTGQIRITHLMQRETIPGICDVGICVRH
ncbi:MAG: gliding motility lipoprotein GldH [Paraprevotella sp.]|nr:gliding motility lipoprotein GldH [Paraprevotella sp.]